MVKIKPVVFLMVDVFFLLLGGAGYFFFNTPIAEPQLAIQVSRALENEMARADEEAETLIAHPRDPVLWNSVQHSFFLIDTSGVVAWSKNDFVPDLDAAEEPFEIRLLQTSYGDFLLKKWSLPRVSYLLLVIPLRKEFSIVNNFLGPEWNKELFQTPLTISPLPSGKGHPVCLAHSGCVFSVSSDVPIPSEAWHVVMLIAFLLATLAGIIFFTMVLWTYHRKGEYQGTFLGLVAALGLLRISMVELNFPNALVKFHLFDPQQFASSSFNSSIGDLFLNSLIVLLLCSYLFNYYASFRVTRRILHAGRGIQVLAAGLCLFGCFLALLFPYLYIEIIRHNSVISIGITESLTFESTRVVALISLLVGCICSFLVTHILIRLALRLARMASVSFPVMLAGAALFFLAFFLATHRSYWITLGLGTVYFALLSALNLSVPLSRLTFRSFLYFLVAIVALCLQSVLAVKRFQEDKKREDMFRYANNILVDQDILGEYLLNASVQRIAKDPFIQVRLATPFLSKTSVRQKIDLLYLGSYFDRYDVRIYLYTARGEPSDNFPTPNFKTVIQGYQRDKYKTPYSGIYFINQPSLEATKKYVAVIPISHYGVVSGFVVLDLTQKKIIPQEVYPELLVDNRFSKYIGNRDYSYAYYSQRHLTSSFGAVNYEKYFDPAWLSDVRLYTDGIRDNDYYHVAVEDKSGQVAVVTTLRYPFSFMITNFSFFFILGLVVLLAFLAITGMLAWLKGRRLNYSSRIQLYVYLAFFFPLVAVSVTTLSLISRADEKQLTNEYLEKARGLSEKISIPLQEFSAGTGSNQNEFQNTVTELAKLANVDASVYAVDGRLLASSQPAIVENHLLSYLMNREAWTSIVLSKDNSFIANERIGKLLYNSSYEAIKSPKSGELLGVLSIPFFTSAASYEQSKMSAMANILTVFVIVFILFSYLSFVVANGLTFPLRLIAQSLQKTTLNNANKLMTWKSNDEIGLLASEYNRMVQNLEQSRTELVRSQKESAWREIAKQVAHEIKNPLTPMKLTLQQWERSLAQGEVSADRAKKSIQVLLAQLETLNDIAGSFSAFARMPAPMLQRVELVRLLRQAVALHATVPEGTVRLEASETQLFVMGDEQLLGRIFSNLILNGLQSGKEGSPVSVVVYAKSVGPVCRVEIKDNGQGIDEQVRDRVFLPHFSTKKTGSGLGLAIARQGIEQSGGKIWFETETDRGTSFFIEFPQIS
jgi:two-component system nitrogen regulation sensor histidine kinase NtrY